MKFILLQPAGGLCNRLRAIHSGIALAQRYGYSLKVHWVLNQDVGFAFDEFFEFPVKFDLGSYLPSDIHIDITIQDYLIKKHLTAGYFDTNALLTEALFDRFQNKSLLIYTCRKFYPYESGSWLENFVPNQILLNRIQEFSACINDNTFGVQIRAIRNPLAVRCSPLERFIYKMKECLEKGYCNNFYLSTDSPLVQRKIIKKFGTGRILFCANNFDRNSRVGLQDAVVDLFLLGKTAKILGSYYSTFSLTASELEGKPFELVIDNRVKNKHAAY